MKPSQASYVPSHAGFVVEFRPGDFSSFLKTTRAFKAGETLAKLEGLTKGPRAYTSVQCGPGKDDHVELNSDLVYVNHSCDPTIAFDLSSADDTLWHVRALKDMGDGDPITFFYPSTEWDMDQPFDCQCNTPKCLGKIQGARYLAKDVLSQHGYINSWIWDLVRRRDVSEKPANTPCLSCGHGLSVNGSASVCGCRK